MTRGTRKAILFSPRYESMEIHIARLQISSVDMQCANNGWDKNFYVFSSIFETAIWNWICGSVIRNFLTSFSKSRHFIIIFSWIYRYLVISVSAIFCLWIAPAQKRMKAKWGKKVALRALLLLLLLYSMCLCTCRSRLSICMMMISLLYSVIYTHKTSRSRIKMLLDISRTVSRTDDI